MSSPPPQPIDLGFLPPSFRGDVQVFTTNNKDVNWQSWTKPRGVSMCWMLAISGGGAGGAGHSRSAGNPGGGGGGGGSGSMSRLIMAAYSLPDELYVQVGLGGLGGTGSTQDGSGSFVSLGRSTIAPNVILRAAAGGSGGSGGSAGAAGTGGNAGGASSASAPSVLGLPSFTAGANGANGGAHTGAIGTAISAVWNAIVLSGGAGGAGCTASDFAGGAVTLQGTADFAAASLLGGLADGGNGSGGIQLWQPFLTSGGSGGGSNNDGTAGAGGKGGIGSGGGGGGAGVTGGRGGDGGNGIVLMVSW